MSVKKIHYKSGVHSHVCLIPYLTKIYNRYRKRMKKHDRKTGRKASEISKSGSPHLEKI